MLMPQVDIYACGGFLRILFIYFQISASTSGNLPLLQPLSFGEGIALDLLPSQELR